MTFKTKPAVVTVRLGSRRSPVRAPWFYASPAFPSSRRQLQPLRPPKPDDLDGAVVVTAVVITRRLISRTADKRAGHCPGLIEEELRSAGLGLKQSKKTYL